MNVFLSAPDSPFGTCSTIIKGIPPIRSPAHSTMLSKLSPQRVLTGHWGAGAAGSRWVAWGEDIWWAFSPSDLPPFSVLLVQTRPRGCLPTLAPDSLCSLIATPLVCLWGPPDSTPSRQRPLFSRPLTCMGAPLHCTPTPVPCLDPRCEPRDCRPAKPMSFPAIQGRQQGPRALQVCPFWGPSSALGQHGELAYML